MIERRLLPARPEAGLPGAQVRAQSAAELAAAIRAGAIALAPTPLAAGMPTHRRRRTASVGQ